MLMTGRLIEYSLVVVLFFPIAASALELASSADLEIVSKHYSSGILPVVGSYVEYEVRLANEDVDAIRDQQLQISFVSEGNKTNFYATYSILTLEPGGSKLLHLGPFKMEEEGWHRLKVAMDGVALNESDSFIVYRWESIQTLLIAIILIAGGAGIVSFSISRKRRRESV